MVLPKSGLRLFDDTNMYIVTPI